MGRVQELKVLRAKYDISQRKMAEMLGMTPASYNRKENGVRKFNIQEAKIIADFFHTTIENIFFAN